MTRIAEDLHIFDKNEWEAIVGELALPPRQREIVQRLFLGQSDKQIAKELGLAMPTVRTHLGRLFARFKVRDRHELILYIFHHFRKGCIRERCPRYLSYQQSKIITGENK
jgi:DNA-binding NarL/FixJ family response regulator